MNVEIGAEAALFPEKEYINGIFVAVYAVFEQKNILIGKTKQYFPRWYKVIPFFSLSRPHSNKT
jgi:hypothetical protein